MQNCLGLAFLNDNGAHTGKNNIAEAHNVILMIHGKVAAALLLLVVPLLTAAQMAGGQTYTTQTITLATSTQVNIVTTRSSVVTTTQPQTRTIFSAPITIPQTHGICGIYFVQAFNATSGAVVSGSLTSDNAVDFYIMTDTAFQAWTHQIVAGGVCTPASLILKQLNTTSYNFSTNIPANGMYDMVVNNLSRSTVNAQLKAGIATSASAVVTMAFFSTMMQPTVQTVIQTTVQTALPAQGDMLNTSALLVVALLVILAAITFAFKRRHDSRGK